MRNVARHMADFEYDDEDKFDMAMGSEVEPPNYPATLQFTLAREDFGKICDGDCAPGMTLRFSAMGTATSIDRGMDDCQIEVELTDLAGENGKFAEMSNPASICLRAAELAKLDLEEECERGDTIHIVGSARVERVISTGYGGDRVVLQITEAAIEDESEEGRG